MSHFPETRHSAVRRAQDQNPEVRARALDALLAAYWKPVYKHLRYGWKASDEEAKDWTQGFFTRFLEKEMLQAFDSARGSFRNYLRLAADSFVSNERKAARRLKRGGEQQFVSLDWVGAEGELREHPPSSDLTPEEHFDREWARALFQLSLAALEAEFVAAGKQVHLRLFERYDLEADAVGARPTYQELAREFELPVTQVTNFLAATRRRFRQLTLERLREITGSDAEFRDEARRLLGAEPS
ncbi:MAG: hypothetical protein U0527_17755 [Candidatus Eisenbacteria bacterium]